MENHFFLHLFHILVVGGFFMYIGIHRENSYTPLFKVALVLGIVIVVYHLYKAYTKYKIGKGYWVNLIHILLVGPLLIYIGYWGNKTTRKFFELLLMLGFASIGYHLFYLLD